MQTPILPLVLILLQVFLCSVEEDFLDDLLGEA